MATPTMSSSPHTITRQEKIFTLTGTLLGMLLAALDNTIVATAGPIIQQDLNIAPSLYVWITTAYLVASTVLIPIYGKLSDLYGRKNVLLFGVVTFLLGSMLCGLATSAAFLILARAVQGVGAAALFVTAFAIVADLFPPAKRGRITGLFGAVFGLSSVLGPLVGGFITDHLSWHWAFFINLPVGLIALAFIILRMPPLKPDLGERRPRIDFLGAFTLVLGVVPLLLALSLGKTHLAPGETGFLWTSWPILGMFALAATGIIAFLLAERRAPDPILDLTLFRNRIFSIGNLGAFVLGAAFLGPIVFLPLYMVNVLDLSATSSGLTITPLTIGIVIGNIASGLLVARLGKYKGLMLGSIALLMTAFLVMALTLSVNANQTDITLKMILIGLGLGPSIPLFTLAIQNGTDPRKTGVVTSAVTFFRSLGQVIGVAVFGTVFANVLTSDLQVAQRALPANLNAPSISAGEGGSSGGFNAAEVKRDIREAFMAQEVLLTRAIRDNDPAATALLLRSEQTPAPLRDAVRSLNASNQNVTGSADARETLLRQAQRGLRSAETQALGAVDTFATAFKAALTKALKQVFVIGLAIVALGFLVTLFLPQLPLRQHNNFGPPAAE